MKDAGGKVWDGNGCDGGRIRKSWLLVEAFVGKGAHELRERLQW